MARRSAAWRGVALVDCRRFRRLVRGSFASEEAANHVGAFSSIVFTLLETHSHPVVPAPTLRRRQTLRQLRALFERLHRAPQSRFDLLFLRVSKRLRRESVTDAASITRQIDIVELPQHAAAVRT